MPVPHIFAGTAGGTTAQLDANNAYLAALRDLFTIAGGNIGLGVPVSVTWDATGEVLQMGPSMALYAPASGSLAVMSSNLVYESSIGTPKYLNTGLAAAYFQQSGRHRWFTASSGSAGGSATMREVLQTDAAGNVIFTNPPSTPPTLDNNGDMVLNMTSNTNLRISYRGSDGVTRVANITLA